jgi:hypothetical protein
MSFHGAARMGKGCCHLPSLYCREATASAWAEVRFILHRVHIFPYASFLRYTCRKSVAADVLRFGALVGGCYTRLSGRRGVSLLGSEGNCSVAVLGLGLHPVILNYVRKMESRVIYATMTRMSIRGSLFHSGAGAGAGRVWSRVLLPARLHASCAGLAPSLEMEMPCFDRISLGACTQRMFFYFWLWDLT